jgi:pimeloyl-ACP methyl ester carboxylesterase
VYWPSENEQWAALASLRCPTLLVRGANSPFPNEIAQRVAEVIPGCEFVEIADSGHSPNIDNPQAFLAVVRSFLIRRA